MTALLLAAHGSRQASSNAEVERLAERLRVRSGGRFAPVTHGFLELASPTLEDGIESCVRGGARRIVVLPYFLAAGRHVLADLPGRLDAKRREHPEVEVRVTTYVGAATEEMTDLLLALATEGTMTEGGDR